MKGLKHLFVGNPYFILQVVLCFIGFHLNSILVFKAAAFLILVYCVILGSTQKYIINPYYLFILTPVSLLIYFNISDAFFVDLTRDTWLLIICNIDVLLIGLTYTKSTHYRERRLGKKYSIKLYTLTALIFSIVGSIPPVTFRITGVTFPMDYIIGMLGTAGVVAAMATKRKILIFIALAINIFPILLGGASKSTVLTVLLATIVSFEKFFTDFKDVKSLKNFRKRIITGCIIAVPIMISAFSFANKDRGTYDADEGFSYYESRVSWNASTSFFLPYMYITTPWANLQYVIETQGNRSYGYWLTKPILGPIFEEALLKKEYVPKAYSSFNTFSFIGLHFKDFGYWGSLIISLFLGFFIKKVYSLFVVSPSPYDATSYVFTAQATLELFFSNHFFGLSYPFMIVIEMYIFKKMMKI